MNRLIMEGVFAVNKPSGMTSRMCLDKVNKVISTAECFKGSIEKLKEEKRRATGRRKRKMKTNRLKVGHGGTLDPLASGVLIIGVGTGTKKLGGFMNGSVKIYEATALLGGSTTTGDSEGQLLTVTENQFVTKELLEQTRHMFIGKLSQTPPIFSALKMNGKPLYEYAREGLPLPREIKPREVSVYSLELEDDCLSTSHNYKFLKPEHDEDGSSIVEKLSSNPTLNDHSVPFSEEYMKSTETNPDLPKEAPPVKRATDLTPYSSDDYRAPLLHFTSKVSSGTYIRSLISDFGRAMGSSAYMVDLVRHRQTDWILGVNCFELSDFEDTPEEVWAPVLERVFAEGTDVNVQEEIKKRKETASEEKQPKTA